MATIEFHFEWICSQAIDLSVVGTLIHTFCALTHVKQGMLTGQAPVLLTSSLAGSAKV
jgi:hypothetical protein